MFDFLTDKFSSLFTRLAGKTRLTEANIGDVLKSVHDALLEADVPYDVTDTFLNELSKEVVGSSVIAKSLKPGEQFAKIVYDRLTTFLGGKNAPEQFTFSIPSVVMMMGLQGSGKTTTAAKLAYYVQQQAAQRGKKRTLLLASVDFYRPAAVEQLEILAKQIGAIFYRSSLTDPVSAAQDILAYFKKVGADLLFLDTAGRLHIDSALLEEIKKIDQVIKPTYKMLVLDAMTGQESLHVAHSFNQSLGFDYAIMTKLDSNTRGGAAFAFRYSLGKSILFMGAGEKVEDLERFHPERMAGRIIGMGDINTLIERAESKIKEHERDAMERSFRKDSLTLDDFGKQLEMVSRMGSLSQLMQSMPMMGAQKLSPEVIEQGQQEMKKFRAIISSMTLKERCYPPLLDASRRRRIAKGAGAEIVDIKNLLDRFEKSQQFVKIFKKLGRVPGLG